MFETETPATESAEVELTPEDVAPGTPASPAKQFVKYIGRASIREISKEAWESIGVLNQGDVAWHLGNAYKLPVSEFTEQALAYFNRDSRLEIVTE